MNDLRLEHTMPDEIEARRTKHRYTVASNPDRLMDFRTRVTVGQRKIIEVYFLKNGFSDKDAALRDIIKRFAEDHAGEV